jgi:hypothetical protein
MLNQCAVFKEMKQNILSGLLKRGGALSRPAGKGQGPQSRPIKTDYGGFGGDTKKVMNPVQYNGSRRALTFPQGTKRFGSAPQRVNAVLEELKPLEEEENFAPITEELSPDMDEEYDGIDHLEEMVNALTKQVDKAKKKRDWALNNVDSKTKLPRPKQRVNALKAEGLWLLASQQIDMLDRDSCSTGIVAYLDTGRL